MENSEYPYYLADDDLSEEEEDTAREKRNIKIGLALVAVAAALVVAIIFYYANPADQYQKALDYALNRQYSEAQAVINNMLPYDEDKVDGLKSLCSALEYYGQDRLSSAANEIENLSLTELTDDQRAKLKEIKDEIRHAYNEFQLKEQQARREIIADYNAKYPQVGMEEEYINYTRLGSAMYQGVKYATDSSNRYFAGNCYYFYHDNAVVLEAYCEDGIITHIEDNTSDKRYSTQKEYIAGKTENNNTTKKPSTDDPYNAADYNDPEDFYEDYYDDFFDYEDAEDYFYDHEN